MLCLEEKGKFEIPESAPNVETEDTQPREHRQESIVDNHG